MHIGFQRSGGRGEYEVVGNHTGYSAIGLEGWSFCLAWPDGIVRDTDLMLEPADSGKPRLRSTRPKGKVFQIGRMVAAMLMLPDPRRRYQDTAEGLPVARKKGYVLSRLGFGPDTEFSGVADLVTIDPVFVDLDNLTDKETIGVRARWEQVSSVYAAMNRLPAGVREPVAQHRDYMASGQSVDEALVSIVAELQSRLAEADSRFSSDYDPLPALLTMLGIAAPDSPQLPPPDEIGEEEPLVSARSAYEYRLTKSRGSSAARFSTMVREAYANRCLFCGVILGGFRGIRSGVDAAHILAWSKFDLDVVPNGICLCKLHHWAFDASLLMPVYEQSGLELHFTELAAEHLDTASMNKLGQHRGVVPVDWLPQTKANWPSKQYLDRLYADLGTDFIS